MKRTPLYELHCLAGAKLVDFAGWEMPIHYGSQIEEHHSVRQAAGIFDVSHMGVVDIEGPQATEFLSYLLANDIAKLKTIGKALYTCMLNEQGGVIDDLIVYRMGDNFYRTVINASRREVDMAWLQKWAKQFDVNVTPREELCIIAVQGPEAVTKTAAILQPLFHAPLTELKPFNALLEKNVQVGRTGYTGEDGFEIILDAPHAINLWQQLIAEGVRPCGLGARDTLRLEAGLNLYGSDMNEKTTPLVSNLAWTVALKDERDFIGRKALLQQKEQGIAEQLVGVVLEQRGVLRDHQTVMLDGDGQGEITSGGFSPTLGYAIGLARIPKTASAAAFVERRGQQIPVKIIKPPFVRNGEKVYE